MASREDIKHPNWRTNSLKTIILEHNYLNGFKFVIVEFGIFILVIAPYCLYYFFHYKFLLAGIASGLISNFIVVLFFAVRSVSRKESSLGITKLFFSFTVFVSLFKYKFNIKRYQFIYNCVSIVHEDFIEIMTCIKKSPF